MKNIDILHILLVLARKHNYQLYFTVNWNRPSPRYGSFGKHRAKVACTYQSLAFNFNKTYSREKQLWLNDNSSIFPSSMSISNQSIVNQNYIENEALVSTVDFRVQSTVYWVRSITDYTNIYWYNTGWCIRQHITQPKYGIWGPTVSVAN